MERWRNQGFGAVGDPNETWGTGMVNIVRVYSLSDNQISGRLWFSLIQFFRTTILRSIWSLICFVCMKKWPSKTKVKMMFFCVCLISTCILFYRRMRRAMLCQTSIFLISCPRPSVSVPTLDLAVCLSAISTGEFMTNLKR